MLMEEEAKKSETTLANTVTKLAITSKEADDVLKKVGLDHFLSLLANDNKNIFLLFLDPLFLSSKLLTFNYRKKVMEAGI